MWSLYVQAESPGQPRRQTHVVHSVMGGKCLHREHNNTFSPSLMFRFLLIRFADRGLVVKGNPDLKLFNQIYWTFFGALHCIALFQPFSFIIQGQLQNSDNRCDILPIEVINRPLDPKNMAGYANIYLVFVYIHWFTYRKDRYLAGICPAKKMSCIGKFRRNTMSYETSQFCLDINLSIILTNPIIFIFVMMFPELTRLSDAL